MKIVVVMGTTKEARMEICSATSKGMGYDTISLDELIKESGVEGLGSFYKKLEGSFILEEILLNKIFENALRGRWGMAIEGEFTKRITSMLDGLGAKFVFNEEGVEEPFQFVGEQCEKTIKPRMYDSQDVENPLNWVRNYFSEFTEIFEGIHKKTTLEVLNEYKAVVYELELLGIHVTREWSSVTL